MEKNRSYLKWVIFKGPWGLKVLWVISILVGCFCFGYLVVSWSVVAWNYFISNIEPTKSIYANWAVGIVTMLVCLFAYFDTDSKLFYQGYLKDSY